MSALVLRLGGSAQSWCGMNLYPSRTSTELVPTRSGLLGLLAACLGAGRGQWPAWLEDTELVVRVDNPGQVERDFHTVNGVPAPLEGHYRRMRIAQDGTDKAVRVSGGTAKQQASGKDPLALGAYDISVREFLAGAEFIVAVGHPTHLDDLARAVREPVFLHSLGRKAFAPTFPFVLGVLDVDPREALHLVPCVGVARTVELVTIASDRNIERTLVNAPGAANRREQLQWATTHLNRCLSI